MSNKERSSATAMLRQALLATVIVTSLVYTAAASILPGIDTVYGFFGYAAKSPGALTGTFTVSNTNDGGPGSLRDAIDQANASPDDNTIDFSIPGCAPATPCTITLTTGEIAIASNGSIAITGPGASSLTLSGNGQSRVLTIASGANVSVTALTLTAGKAPDSVPGTPAANGGAILNLGTLALTDVTVSASFAGNGRPGGGQIETMAGHGGAIYSTGALSLSGVTLSNNHAGTGGSGLDCSGSCGSIFFSGDGGSGGGIYSTGTLVVDHLTANANGAGPGGQGANTIVGDIGGPGGKGGYGGVIYSAGTVLQMTSSTLTGNNAGEGGRGGAAPLASGSPIGTYGGFGGDGGRGGAIYNAAGTSTITGVLMSGNHAGNAGDAGRGNGGGFTGNSGFGGIGGFGGGIFSAAAMTLTNSTVSGNTAGVGGKNGEAQNPSQGVAGGDGGGIYSTGGMTVTGTTIIGNIAGGGGFGSFANSGGSGGAGGRGGGLFATTLPVVVSNSTISANSAGVGGAGGNCFGQTCGHSFGGNGGDGGGLIALSGASLTNVTISNNSTGSGGQGGFDHNFTPGVVAPGGLAGGISASATTIRNTIVAKNIAAGTTFKDVQGTYTSRGHNFIGQKDGSSGFTDGVNGDQVGTNGAAKDPLLGPLQNNGGPTPTQNLPPNSPAVNAGDNCVLTVNGCADSNPSIATDQRGLVRPQAATVDIGAVEAITSVPNTPDLTTTADTGTSSSDNLTGAATLEFQITGAIPTSTLDLLRSGTVVTTAQADAGGNVNFSYADAVPDGVYSFTARYAISGASGTASSGLNVTIDRTPPSSSINQTGGQADPTNTQPINFTAGFSEPVVGFTNSDVTLTGTAGNIGSATIGISGSGSPYGVAVSGLSSSGSVTASLATGVATDAAGNPNLASTTTDDTVTLDITAPTVTIVQAVGQSDPTSDLPISFTVTFSEPVTGFTNADILLTGSTANVAAASINVTGGGALYTVTIGNITTSGTVQPTIPANAVVDASGNFNTASAGGDNVVTYDLPAPSVTIDQAVGQNDPTNQQPINFTVVFSEPVTGFTNTDVSLAGSTANVASAVISVTGPGPIYNVAISNITGSGSVEPTIPANKAINSDGDGNTASTSVDNTVVLDITPPTVTIDQAAGQSDPASTEPVNFSVVFSEPVTGFSSTGVGLTGSTADVSAANINVTGGGAIYNVAISNVRSAGVVQAAILAAAAVDAVGNNSLASSSTDNTVAFTPTVTELVVNLLGDAGDGTCDATCTLRDAVLASNATAGIKHITFNLPACLLASPCTITLTGGELPVNANGAVNINGPGVAALSINGNNTSRIMTTATSSLVSIADLSITGGRAATNTNGGGILSGGRLSLTRVSVSGNAAGPGSIGSFASGAAGHVGGHGGGIYNDGGELTLTGCTIAVNLAGAAGDGSTGFGTGSIGNGGPGGSGGGIFNNGGTLTITSSTLSGNTAGNGGLPGAQNGNGLRIGFGGDGGHGGGIYSTGGGVTISNSTFSADSAGNGAVGLGFQGQHGGNGGSGGAIFLGGGNLFVVNGTISGSNGGNAGPGDFGASAGTGGSGGGVFAAAGAKMRNTIAANNGAPSSGPDLSGAFASLGHNFIGRSDGSTGFVDGTNGDKVGTVAAPKDPLLGPLQDNGGPTQTLGPAATSTVKDAGDNCVLTHACPADNLDHDLNTDQRGLPRPQGITLDIGSVEILPAIGAPDLADASDTGTSASDDLTNAAVLHFQAGGAAPGATVQLVRNASIVATGVADGSGVADLTYADTSADGLYSFTSRVVISGAFGPPSVALGVTIDRTGPMVTSEQAAGQSDPTSLQPIDFTVAFNEPVFGFTAGDVSLTGSTADVSSANIAIAGTGPTYTVSASNIVTSGDVRVLVPAAAVSDAAGNGNTISTSTDNTVTLNIQPPTVTIEQAVGQADPINVLPINFTVVFSTPVTGFTATDISFAGSTAGVNGATVNVTGSGTTYNVAVGNITSGDLVVSVPANSATGIGGGNQASTSADNTVTYDTAPPQVTINQAAAQADPTSTQPVNFTAVFNRAVTGFGPGGVSLAGSTADVSGATVTVTGTGPAYNVAVGNIQSSGTVRATVLAGAATGLGGATQASTSTDNEVTVTANTLVVNLTSDDGDETCDATCTLRDAINNANASPGFDDITFDLPSCTGAPVCTVTLIKGPFFPVGTPDPLTITSGSNISIHGPGIGVLAIDGNRVQQFNSTRIFTVQSGARLSVTDLTITNGVPSDFEGNTNYRGGGIYNDGGNVFVSNVLFTGNRARIGFQGGFNGGVPGTAGSEGGAIYNADGTINVSNCTFTANSGGKGGQGGGSSVDTGAGPGGPGGPGGAIYNAAIMTVTGSTFNNNTAGAGGAPGTRNNNDSLPRGSGGNGGNGGAIYNTGTLFLVNSTLSGNNSGAGANGGQNGSGGNSGSGGAIFNSGGTLLIVNSTIANGAVAAPGVKGTLGVQNGTAGNGGGVVAGSGVVRLRSTIIAKNAVATGGLGPDVIGAFSTLGHNLIGKSDGSTGFADGTASDQVGSIAFAKDPLLGALLSNGGLTQTLEIAAGSPAKNTGDNCVVNASCPNNNLAFNVTTDQRGVGRPKGPAVDIGAFEVDLATASAALTSSNNPALTGQPVTFTSTITGSGSPTGSVTFSDGGTPLSGCSGVTVISGTATCLAPSLTQGDHTITAQYSGDANFNPAAATLAGNPQVITNMAVWTGSANTDWNNAANWSTGFVPAAIHNVNIPAAGVTNQPAIPIGTLTTNDLTIAVGRTLNITGGDLTVNGVLTMNGGDITVAPGHTLTLGSGGSATRTSGAVVGTLKKLFAAPGAFTYPVGAPGDYSPVDANVTTGTGSLTVKANTGLAPATPALNPLTVLHRYWSLSGTGITADITWHYLQTDVPGTSNEAAYGIIRIAGGGPGQFLQTNGTTRLLDTALNTFTVKSVSVFSDWLVGQPLAPTAANVNISGRVLDPGGRGLPRSYVTLTDGTGNTVYAVTNPFGYYRFQNIAAGANYLIGVTNKRYTFTSRFITVSDEVTELDLVPEP